MQTILIVDDEPVDREAELIAMQIASGTGLPDCSMGLLDKARLFDTHGRGVMLASATLELKCTPPGNRVTVRVPLDGES